MKDLELQPIVLSDDIENVADILASSESLESAYIPEISCTGVGGAACKEGCISGCKNSTKDGRDCAQSCKDGCQDGCLAGCKNGCKRNNKESQICKSEKTKKGKINTSTTSHA